MSDQANNRLAEDNDFNFEQRICLRDSCDADIPAITSIYAYHVLQGTASFEIEPPCSVVISLRRGELLRRGYPYLVAEDSSGVVGYAYAGPSCSASVS
jgi:L-amino acid N-acyltransferase YncA